MAEGHTERPSWQELARLEPGLAWLEREAKAYGELGCIKKRIMRLCAVLPPDAVPLDVQRWAGTNCANAIWYGPGGLKERMSELAGWYARNPALRTREAYDVAYDHLYQLLPDCWGCACL